MNSFWGIKDSTALVNRGPSGHTCTLDYSLTRYGTIMRTLSAILVGSALALSPVRAEEARIRVLQGSSVAEVEAVAPNIVRIHFQPNGQTTARTLVMDPAFQPAAVGSVRLERNGAAQTLSSPEMKVIV